MYRIFLAAGLAQLALALPAAANDVNVRAVGGFSQSNWTRSVEAPFYTETLKNKYGIIKEVTFTPIDQLGIKFDDILRMINTDVFDVANIGIANVAKDYPILEGIDISGAFPSFSGVRQVLDDVRFDFDQRLQEKFKVKLLTLWPFGPLGIFCRGDVDSFDDIAGKKIRVFTRSQSELVAQLGATAVTIQANEVYSALERGLLDCAITASSFGNNLKWTEVTDAYIDVSMGMAITGHIMSLNKWNSLDDHQKLVMETAFRELENTLWRYSLDMKDDANRCNSGLDPCANHTKYDLRYVSVSDEDVAKLRNLAQTVTVPSWEASCAQVLGDDCKSVWNEHIARHAGFAIGN